MSGTLLARWLFTALVASCLAACGGGDSATVGSSTGTSATGAANGSAVPAVTTSSASSAVAADNGTVPANVFSAVLDGTQEVPAVTSSGSATGIVLIDTSSRILKASIATSGIAATAVSIQQAITGATGPVIFPLAETATGSGVWTTQATLTTAQLATLTIGGYFFNVASSAHPGGEIRGQILHQLPLSGTAASTTTSTTAITGIPSASVGSTTTFVNVLSAGQQVPASGSAAMGVGVTIVSPTAPTLSVSVITLGMVGTSADIRVAAPGILGPTMLALSEATSGSGLWVARANLTAAQSTSLTGGGTYFEIHSAAFPNGEIRGQIVTTSQAAAIGASAVTGRAKTGTGGTTGTTGITGTTGTTGITGIASVPASSISGIGSQSITGFGTAGVTGITGATGITTMGTIGSAGATGIGTGSVPTLGP